jgi:putative SOS response-associated peptidase YedK
MCGRYTLFKDNQELAKRYNLAKAPDYKTNYNITPGQIMPIIKSENSSLTATMMKWGLVPKWAKDPKIGYKLINARADTIFEKPIWKNLILHKRCLVPFNGFYEWQRDIKEQKQPYYIHPKKQAIASFAGIWEVFSDTEGQNWHTYAIITTSPNQEMSAVHDRMPVILKPNQEASWLDPSLDNPQDIQQFFKPLTDGDLEVYKVSKDVNSPRHNSQELIYALDE